MTTPTNPGGLGRPSLFTDKVRRQVLAALRIGCTRQAAASFAGISHRTLRSWLAKAAPPPKDEADDSDDSEPDPFTEFRDEVEAAEGLCQARLSGALFQAALTDPRQAQWLLERRFPAEWSRAATERRGEEEREPPRLADARGIMSRIDVTKLTTEQLKRIANGEDPAVVLGATVDAKTGVVILPPLDDEGGSYHRSPTIYIPPESDD